MSELLCVHTCTHGSGFDPTQVMSYLQMALSIDPPLPCDLDRQKAEKSLGSGSSGLIWEWAIS